MQVLVVEDDLMQAFTVMDCLEAAGHEVVGLAPDADLAMVLAERHAPDLALVDLSLRHGGMGDELARKLRDVGVPSMFVTGYEVMQEQRNAALGCISKPVEPDAVAKGVAAAQTMLSGGQPGDLPEGVEVFGRA